MMTTDLHGLTQAEAQARLTRDVSLAALRGERVLKVITGRGHSQKGADQGVLRLAVPRWLKTARFRRLVRRVAEEPGNPGALIVELAGRPAATADRSA